MRELWGSPGQWNARKTYVEVARKLGVDEETVRNRIAFMKESGFLLGWRLVPNPALFRRKSVFLLLDLEEPDSKDEIISDLKRMDGVIVITSIYDKRILLSLCDDEMKESSKQIGKLGIRAEMLGVPAMGFPPTNFQMKPTDWEISRELLRDAERKVADVASKVKVSTKTVKRRLDSMKSASAIFIMPMVNLKKSGGISYNLMIYAEEGKRDEVTSLVAAKIENLVFRATASENGLIFGFNGANLAEGNDLLKWVKHQAGVKSADLYMVEQVVYAFDWLEREIESRIAGKL